jgi:excisionase family DNA binding protein
MLGYTVQHIRRLVKAGALRGEKVGRDWIVYRASVEAFMAHRANTKLSLPRGSL